MIFSNGRIPLHFVQQTGETFSTIIPSDITRAIGKSAVAMPYVIFDEFTEQRQKGLILFPENTWKAVEDTVTSCYSRPLGGYGKSLHFIENMRAMVFLEDSTLFLPKKLAIHAEIRERGVIWQDGLEFWLASR